MEPKKRTDLTGEFTGTVYSNRNARKGMKTITLKEWIEVIKNNSFEHHVNLYRKLLAEGKIEEARGVKSQLMAFICTAICMDGRKEGDEEGRSCLVMADYDRHDAEWAAGQRDALKTVPWVAASHLTVSCGLRVFIYVPLFPREHFKEYLKVVLHVLDAMVGYKHDPQATNLLRLSYVSHDPDAWCRNPEECTKFPLEEYIQQPTLQPMLPVEAPPTAVAACPTEILEVTCLPACSVEADSSLSVRRCTDTQLDQLLSHFLQYHSLRPGHRNDSFLKLGAYARYCGLTLADLNQLIDILDCLYGDAEYTHARIAQCMNWGYEHSHESGFNQQNVSQTTGVPAGSPWERKSPKSPKSPRGVFGLEKDDKSAEYAGIQLYNNQAIEALCPYFPKDVYDQIPGFLKPILSLTSNKRVEDLRLASLFTVLSAAMPNVRVLVRSKKYSTHLFTFGIGPAASGKSAALEPVRLLSTINKRFQQYNKQLAKEKYVRDQRWNSERLRAQKENREMDLSLAPDDEQDCFTFLGGAQTSRSKLIINLKNAPHGIFIATSELDVLTNCMGSEYGKLSAELRCAAMNEPVSSDFKSDGHAIQVDFPMLAILATGTFDQLVHFLDNMDDGMASRMFILLESNMDQWISWGDSDEEEQQEELDLLYEQATDHLTQIYDYLEKNPTVVSLSKEDRIRADNYFCYFTNQLKEEQHTELLSIIKRAPIHVSRICGILCGIRKAEMGLTERKMIATKEDVTLALHLVSVLIWHTVLATTMLQDKKVHAQRMKPVFLSDTLFAKLQDQFTTNDVFTVCREFTHLSRSSVFKHIKKWVDKSLVVRVEHGVYKKVAKACFPTD